MKFRDGLLLIWATFLPIAHAATNSAEPDALPPSKVYIEPCQRQALLLHSGVIEKQRLLHSHSDFLIRYEIQSPDGSEWFVLCNLANGSIIREQRLVDEAF